MPLNADETLGKWQNMTSSALFSALKFSPRASFNVHASERETGDSQHEKRATTEENEVPGYDRVLGTRNITGF